GRKRVVVPDIGSRHLPPPVIRSTHEAQRQERVAKARDDELGADHAARSIPRALTGERKSPSPHPRPVTPLSSGLVKSLQWTQPCPHSKPRSRSFGPVVNRLIARSPGMTSSRCSACAGRWITSPARRIKRRSGV